MEVGLGLPNGGAQVDPAEVVRLAVGAEEIGLDARRRASRTGGWKLEALGVDHVLLQLPPRTAADATLELRAPLTRR